MIIHVCHMIILGSYTQQASKISSTWLMTRELLTSNKTHIFEVLIIIVMNAHQLYVILSQVLLNVYKLLNWAIDY
jgi:hypothetical protein